MQEINEISKKHAQLGSLIEQAYKYAISDPSTSLTKSRKALEIIINEKDPSYGRSLYEKISNVGRDTKNWVVTYMHFIRRLGNDGAHNDDCDSVVARDVVTHLITLAKWHLNFKIEESHTERIEARFFIADPIFNTWAKIAILTSDGVFYSEYLFYMKLRKYIRTDINFYSFVARDFSFGKDEHNSAYQPIREVSKEEALRYVLERQSNWVQEYLIEKGIK